MKRASPLAAALATVLFPMGCAIIAGLDGDNQLALTSGTSGAGGDASTCPLATVPGPPADTSGGGDAGGGEDIVVALRAIDLGEGINEGKVGLDLDGTCTCPAENQCEEPAWATADHCDGEEGRDNATGQAFAAINSQVPGTVSSGVLRSQMTKGEWSLLLRVRGYNGGPEDGEVEVDVYPTTGLADQGITPSWDGNDAWPIADTGLIDKQNLDVPVAVDTRAYVTGGILVAHPKSTSILFVGSLLRLGVQLSSVTISGRIEPSDAGGKKISAGLIAGAWALTDLFQGLSDLRYEGGKALCRNSGVYQQIRDTLCSVTDIRLGSASPELCDALSFGMTFESVPAKLGMVAQVPPLPGDPCSASAGDPKDDSCGAL